MLLFFILAASLNAPYQDTPMSAYITLTYPILNTRLRSLVLVNIREEWC